MVEKAKVFTNGGSQAIRLPKDCRYEKDEVIINRIGYITIITPEENRWEGMLRSLDMFSDDFLKDGRDELPAQERDTL